MKDLDQIRLLMFKKWRSTVSSSNVDRVKFDDSTMELVIDFLDGSSYTYFDVTLDIYESIVDGDARARTTDLYGRWKAGQSSVGAGVHQFLIEQGVRYSRN
jgi:hypothetical protein